MCHEADVKLPSIGEVLAEAGGRVGRRQRVALCQIVRTEGSTPGKPGWKMGVTEDGAAHGNLGGGSFEALVLADARRLLAAPGGGTELKRYYFTEEAVRGEPTGMVCGGLAEVFLEVLMPRPLLAICGGGPVGQALARNAALCDFDLLVVEDRAEFRRPELFPERTRFAEVDRDYSQDFLAEAGERDLHVVVVTRCWETDLAALAAVLRQRPSGTAYLGLMGSRRKVDRVREELERRGFDLTGVDLRAPIGLPIGGDTPAEIAISILAEVIQLRSGSGAAEERPELRAAAP